MKWLCIFLIISYHHGFAQSSSDPTANTGEYIGISGSPYFLKDWSEGVIRFTSGKVTDKFKIRFNSAQNRLILEFNGSAFAAESKVNEFVIYTRKKKDSFLFRKGFPSIGNSNKETFYQVLETGQVTLLRLPIKEIIEEKSIYGPKPTRHYQDLDEFYLLVNGTMHKVDKDIKSIEDILSDRWQELKSYISEHQLRMTTMEDLTKVVKKYNELTR
jgi:hypothetical protein